MKITLNNELLMLKDDTMSIADLLKEKNFTFKMLVIKINGNLVRKNDYATTLIKEGDVVNVLHLISGG